MKCNLTANSNVGTNCVLVNLAPLQYRRKDTGVGKRGSGKAARDERGKSRRAQREQKAVLPLSLSAYNRVGRRWVKTRAKSCFPPSPSPTSYPKSYFSLFPSLSAQKLVSSKIEDPTGRFYNCDTAVTALRMLLPHFRTPRTSSRRSDLARPLSPHDTTMLKGGSTGSCRSWGKNGSGLLPFC